MPWVTYTEPEVGRAGLNERETKAKGVAVEVTRYDLHELDRAIVDDAREGFVKVLTPPGRDRILGVTIVAPRAGEMLAKVVMPCGTASASRRCSAPSTPIPPTPKRTGTQRAPGATGMRRPGCSAG